MKIQARRVCRGRNVGFTRHPSWGRQLGEASKASRFLIEEHNNYMAILIYIYIYICIPFSVNVDRPNPTAETPPTGFPFQSLFEFLGESYTTGNREEINLHLLVNVTLDQYSLTASNPKTFSQLPVPFARINYIYVCVCMYAYTRKF